MENQILENNLIFTYDVEYVLSARLIGSRWDVYEKFGDSSIHWVSILNSLFVTFLLSLVIFYILKKALNKDI